ncbi:hypothetical protein G9A89_022820 [Geosiphon pyriformis]|nr:hypothetical protein G9A89_022820 [Geosiphon pyriformis]
MLPNSRASGKVKRPIENNKTLSVTLNPGSTLNVLYYLSGKYPNEEVEGNNLKCDTKIYIFPLKKITKTQKSFYSNVHTLFIRSQEILNINILTAHENTFYRNSFNTALQGIALDYSRIIEDYVKELGKLEQSNPEKYKAEYEVTTEIFAIWELCRILFMAPASRKGKFSSSLVYWVNKFFPPLELSQEEITKIEDSFEPQMEPAFTSQLIKLVLRGDVRAQNMLNLCRTGDETSITDHTIKLIIQLMNNKPQVRDHEELDFNLKWGDWRAECSKLHDELNLVDQDLQKILAEVLMILEGDDHIIIQNSLTWAGALGSLLLHHYPTIDLYELRNVLDLCLLHKPPKDPQDTEQAFIKFLHLKINEGLLHCYQNDLWLTSHLSDLLYKFRQNMIPEQSSALSSLSLDWIIGYREFRLLEYGEILAGHPTLWSIAFDYLRYCPTFGHNYIQELVIKVPLDNEFKINKILDICKVNDLREEAQYICKIAANKYLREKRWTSSLSYLVRANDALQIKLIAHQFLNDVIETGELKFEDTINSLPVHEISDVSLNFLMQYCEFHHMLKQENYDMAKHLLITLIRSQESPRKFWPVLLLNALPILRNGGTIEGKPIFSKEDIFDILCILEEITSTRRKQEFDKCIQSLMQWHTREQGYDEIDEKLKVIRLELAKDSAKAFIAKK